MDDDLDDVLPLGGRVNDTEILDMERDRRAHERPNEHVDDTFDACSGSRYRTHSFSVADPAGHKCKFCGRTWRACLRVQ